MESRAKHDSYFVFNNAGGAFSVARLRQAGKKGLCFAVLSDPCRLLSYTEYIDESYYVYFISSCRQSLRRDECILDGAVAAEAFSAPCVPRKHCRSI